MAEPNQNTALAKPNDLIVIDFNPPQSRAVLTSMVQQHFDDFARRLPPWMSPEEFTRSVVIACEKNPKLLTCTKKSIFDSALAAAEIGLPCHGAMNQGHMIQYGKTCQFVAGYRGMSDLVVRGSEMDFIRAVVVWSCDHFDLDEGTHTISHKPHRGERPEGAKKEAVYAQGIKDGKVVSFKVLWPSDVLKIRNNSSGFKAFQNGLIKSTPWVGDGEDGMWLKTAIRAFCSSCPISLARVARSLEVLFSTDPDLTYAEPLEVAPTSARDMVRPANVSPSKPGAPAPEVKTIAGTVCDIAELNLEGTPGFLVYFADKSSEIPFPVFIGKRHVEGVVRRAAAGTVFTVNARPAEDIFILVSWGTIVPPAPAEKKDDVIDVKAEEVKG